MKTTITRKHLLTAAFHVLSIATTAAAALGLLAVLDHIGIIDLGDEVTTTAILVGLIAGVVMDGVMGAFNIGRTLRRRWVKEQHLREAVQEDRKRVARMSATDKAWLDDPLSPEFWRDASGPTNPMRFEQ